MKLKTLAFLTVGLFAASTAFAGEGKACCAHGGAKQAKMDCSATFAHLNLTAEQKTKMEKLAADCEKGGCNEQTMVKMEREAKGILTEEQFVSWRAKCAGHKHSEKKTS